MQFPKYPILIIVAVIVAGVTATAVFQAFAPEEGSGPPMSSELQSVDPEVAALLNTSTSSRTTTVVLFFGNTALSLPGQGEPGEECTRVYPVERTIVWTPAIARAATILLLNGPTDEEKERGYVSSIPGGAELQSIALTEGLLSVDFNTELDRTGGSCRVAAIRKEISETLSQFPSVLEVLISVDGRTEDILQP